MEESNHHEDTNQDKSILNGYSEISIFSPQEVIPYE
jgi:hypothetical protein